MNARFTFAALCVAAAACGGDDQAAPDAALEPDADVSPREVALTFAPQVGDAPFACGRRYPGLGAEQTEITPRDFRIYVHDLELIRRDGERVPLALDQDGEWQYEGVALLDFEDASGGCVDGNAETHTTIRGTAPAGDYTGVAFQIGIPAELNHRDLIAVPAPLNLTSLWWSWNSGHLFLAIASHADLAAGGTNDHYVHVGSTGCTGDPAIGEPVSCAKPNRAVIELTGFDPLAQPIIADYGAVLARSALASSVGCHSFTEPACGWPFELIGLNWFTGTVTPTTQQLFRVAR